MPDDVTSTPVAKGSRVRATFSIWQPAQAKGVKAVVIAYQA